MMPLLRGRKSSMLPCVASDLTQIAPLLRNAGGDRNA